MNWVPNQILRVWSNNTATIVGKRFKQKSVKKKNSCQKVWDSWACHALHNVHSSAKKMQVNVQKPSHFSWLSAFQARQKPSQGFHWSHRPICIGTLGSATQCHSSCEEISKCLSNRAGQGTSSSCSWSVQWTSVMNHFGKSNSSRWLIQRSALAKDPEWAVWPMFLCI